MPQINYNPEIKILSIKFSEGKSVDSDVVDNVVLDYDKDGHIVNIDVMEVNIEDVIRSDTEKMKKEFA